MCKDIKLNLSQILAASLSNVYKLLKLPPTFLKILSERLCRASCHTFALTFSLEWMVLTSQVTTPSVETGTAVRFISQSKTNRKQNILISI